MSRRPLVGLECACGHGQGRHAGRGRQGACSTAKCDCGEFTSAGERQRVTMDDLKAISEADILRADRENLSYAEIAAQFGTSEKAVWRARRRAKLTKQPQRPVTKDELARVHMLSAEGMPATWIAEDVRRGTHWVRKRVRGGVDRDWASAWHQIRNRPELLALHYEFAPPPS